MDCRCTYLRPFFYKQGSISMFTLATSLSQLFLSQLLFLYVKGVLKLTLHPSQLPCSKISPGILPLRANDISKEPCHIPASTTHHVVVWPETVLPLKIGCHCYQTGSCTLYSNPPYIILHFCYHCLVHISTVWFSFRGFIFQCEINLLTDCAPFLIHVLMVCIDTSTRNMIIKTH